MSISRLWRKGAFPFPQARTQTMDINLADDALERRWGGAALVEFPSAVATARAARGANVG